MLVYQCSTPEMPWLLAKERINIVKIFPIKKRIDHPSLDSSCWSVSGRCFSRQSWSSPHTTSLVLHTLMSILFSTLLARASPTIHLHLDAIYFLLSLGYAQTDAETWSTCLANSCTCLEANKKKRWKIDTKWYLYLVFPFALLANHSNYLMCSFTFHKRVYNIPVRICKTRSWISPQDTTQIWMHSLKLLMMQENLSSSIYHHLLPAASSSSNSMWNMFINLGVTFSCILSRLEFTSSLS